MRIKNVGKVSVKEVQAVVDNQELSKSAKMKQMFLLGLDVKEISTRLGVRYNFVYNVISNLVRMETLDVETEKKEGKKDQIIALHLAGKNNTEISSELKTNYQYVYKTVKDFKKDQEAKEKAVGQE